MQSIQSQSSGAGGGGRSFPWRWALSALVAFACVIMTLALADPGVHRIVALVVGMTVYAGCVRACFRHGRPSSVIDV